jgi:hypothetical protein
MVSAGCAITRMYLRCRQCGSTVFASLAGYGTTLIAILCLVPFVGDAQPGSNTNAGLAGLTAGSALGGANQSGAAQAAGAGAGGGTTPIEIQLMAYKGLTRIASDVAIVAVKKLCKEAGVVTDSVVTVKCQYKVPLLVEDPTSATEIALYEAVAAYHDQLQALYTELKERYEDAARRAAEVTDSVTHRRNPNLRSEVVSPAVAGAPTPAPAATPTAPLWMSEFGSLSTALGGLKTGMTYTASAFQPTNQAFEVLVENELRIRNIDPYTSTSALDLTIAATELTSSIFADMLGWSAEITDWSNSCKSTLPGGGGTTGNQTKPTPPPPPPACSDAKFMADLPLAQQMSAGYTTLIQSPSDGGGNPVLVDVLRGAVLSKALKGSDGKIRSLQLTVAAAAGGTRSNQFFLLDIFYVPKPNYNSGVIVTFELRDGNNALLASGARTAFYKYKWLHGDPFDSDSLNKDKDRTHDAACKDKKDTNDKKDKDADDCLYRTFGAD